MSKLPGDLRQMIDSLCQKGDQFAQIDQFDDALDQFEAAWELLPEPKQQWPAATWILMAAGDAYFEKNDFVAAIDAFGEALECPGGESHPYLLLRLGQSLFESGDFAAAAEHLEAAFQQQGAELFADEDPKYLGFLAQQLGTTRDRLRYRR